MAGDDFGPDIVIVGAARSGTSYLHTALGRHARIDPGALKEPDFFNARWAAGVAWYDTQFSPRTPDLLRLDSSVSYTYPQYPEALKRLRAVAPRAKIIYAVREPISRLVSMYQLHRYYGSPDRPGSLAEALESEMYVLSGDYGLWLERIGALFPADQIFVVPFPLITTNVSAGLDVLLPWLGLGSLSQLLEPVGNTGRNEVRQFRWRRLAQLRRRMRRSTLYPALVSAIGPDRLRTLRRLTTRPAAIPSPADELATLSPAQRHRLNAVAADAASAASDWLRDQDRRYDLTWARAWNGHLEDRRF